METKRVLIRLRIDVDYPYPSRFRSFLYTGLGIRTSREYLKNSKIVARMINESPYNVKAYWFFTLKTIPDKELFALLNNNRHEVGLHIVRSPHEELTTLENSAGRKIGFYTIHGTARLLARFMWGRWRSWAPTIPAGFSLRSFHQFPTVGLDGLCYSTSLDQTLKTVEASIKKGHVVYFHPIWLFQRGRLNRRGPFYEAFRKILAVDAELESISTRRKLRLKLARDQREYAMSIVASPRLIKKLEERGVDVFMFLERGWCCKIKNPDKSWKKVDDNVALLRLNKYDEWWNSISKKTRNMVRKAEKSGIKTSVAEPDEKLAKGMWKIYNETPIRQERGFPNYGTPFNQVVADLHSAQDCTYISADFQDELAGFIQLVHGENISIISQILSLQKHRDKAVNNALVAKTIEVCADRQVGWVMYGRMGNHPTLDDFKQSNGFARFQLIRYYVPLTRKGRLAVKLGLHKEIKDALPMAIKRPLFPIYNWVSRTETRIKLRLKPRLVSQVVA